MFLEFIPCSKVQKYYLQNPEISLKKARNYTEKLRKNKKSAVFSGEQTEESLVRNPTLWLLYDMGLGTLPTKRKYKRRQQIV